MKILQLTKKFPFPLKDGESIAVSNLSVPLNSLGVDITLLSMNTIKHYISQDAIPSTFDQYKEIHTVDLDNRVTVLGAIKNLFSKDSYHVSRFYFPAFKSKLIELLNTNRYDFVLLETLYLAPYIDIIKAHSKAIIVMRSHNVEFEIWNRIASNTSFLPKKIYVKYLAKKLRNFEIDMLKKYDMLVTVTQRDLEAYQKLGYEGKGIAIPIGLNSEEYISKPKRSKLSSISFIGSLDWMPNLEGLDWFINNVWSSVTAKHPDVKLHIAGRNMPDHIKRLKSKNIVIAGEVDDAQDFINQHPVMIVPLFSGSGMRVKILEGMALSRIVISTTVGMEGIQAKDKSEILKADTADEFITSINWIIENPNSQMNIAKNAKLFIANNFDRMINAEKLFGILQEELRGQF